MYPKLDDILRELVVCPLCKTDVTWLESECVCPACGQHFACSSRGIWDFIPKHPTFLQTEQLNRWLHAQAEYEGWYEKVHRLDDYNLYLAEMDSVREIYTSEFDIDGFILDVGGGDGRLRHFLPSSVLYLSVDPQVSMFDTLIERPNLLRAYPCLQEPCNFLRAQAEHLPLRAASFDCVHMRSVLDHFFDPCLALYEARRILRPGGGLMIGVFIEGGASTRPRRSGFPVLMERFRQKVRDEGWGAAIEVATKRLVGHTEHDHHIWHPNLPELLSLLGLTCFEAEKIHWQKPPYGQVVYIMARKQ